MITNSIYPAYTLADCTQISQRVVDCFRGKPDDLLPYCELRVSSCAGTQVGSKLEERVELKGAEEPFNYFKIECTCGAVTPGVYACACVGSNILSVIQCMIYN